MAKYKYRISCFVHSSRLGLDDARKTDPMVIISMCHTNSLIDVSNMLGYLADDGTGKEAGRKIVVDTSLDGGFDVV